MEELPFRVLQKFLKRVSGGHVNALKPIVDGKAVQNTIEHFNNKILASAAVSSK